MWLALCALFFSAFSQAAILELAGRPLRKISASDREIVIFPEARLKLDPTKESLVPRVLKLTGAGVREKSILMLRVNVYAMTSYADTPIEKWGDNPMKAIEQGVTEAIQMTLLRDLAADKVRESFKTALEENDVPTDSEAMKKIFNALIHNYRAGDVITIASQKGEKGNEFLHMEAPNLRLSVSGPGVATDFWKIWFGKSADSGLERLQKDLLSAER